MGDKSLFIILCLPFMTATIKRPPTELAGTSRIQLSCEICLRSSIHQLDIFVFPAALIAAFVIEAAI